MKSFSTESFEDERWANFAQSLEFRHTATLELIPEGPVLDIGCGDGLVLSLLAEKGIESRGIDISSEAVRKCHERGLRAEIFDPSKPLPFNDNTFETVLLLDVLEHVYEPTLLLAEAVRISRNAVIISVPNFSSLPARIQVLRGQVPENNRPGKGHVYWFTHDILTNMTRKQGLSCEDMRMNTVKILSRLGVSASVWPSALALSFVARYTKKT